MKKNTNETTQAPASELAHMPLEIARSRLAAIWLIGSGLMFGLLTLQSIMGRYGSQLQQAWSWFIPTVLPTLSLMLGVIGVSALGKQDLRDVRKDYYNIARFLSLAYLAVLAMTVLLEPFSPMNSIQLFTASNYWLTPLQGLVVGVIGVLFTTNQKSSSRARSQ